MLQIRGEGRLVGKREREREGEKIMSEQRGARRGRVTARLMDSSVFVRAENRKLASDKHNILLLIFPDWLPWNPSLVSESPLWKLLPLTGSIQTREIPLCPACVPQDGQCQMGPNKTYFSDETRLTHHLLIYSQWDCLDFSF